MASENMKVLGVIITAAVVLSVVGAGVYWIVTYNSLVEERENIDARWAQVQNQYQRKFDLIPQLLNVTQAYLDWEAGTYANITSLRTQWANALAAGDDQAAINASNGLDAYAATIILTVENYPDLSGVVVVNNLMYEISGTENRIATERMYYNEAVLKYNSHIKKFPANRIARNNGFEEKAYYTSPNAPAAP